MKWDVLHNSNTSSKRAYPCKRWWAALKDVRFNQVLLKNREKIKIWVEYIHNVGQNIHPYILQIRKFGKLFKYLSCEVSKITTLVKPRRYYYFNIHLHAFLVRACFASTCYCELWSIPMWGSALSEYIELLEH